jgi:hypothetical protein
MPIDQTQPGADEHSIDTLPAETQAYIKSLRKEAGDNRVARKSAEEKIKELSDKASKLDTLEAELASKSGEYQKLYETTKAERDALLPFKTTAEKYETNFQAQLDAVLKSAPEAIKNLMQSSSLSLPEKIEAAKELLKVENLPGGESPANHRSGSAGVTVGDLIKQAQGAKSDLEKATALMALKNKDPEAYHKNLEQVG